MMDIGQDWQYVETAPSTPTSTGKHPSISYDSTYGYMTIADNTWRRWEISNFAVIVDGLLEIEGSTTLVLIEGTTDDGGISLE